MHHNSSRVYFVKRSICKNVKCFKTCTNRIITKIDWKQYGLEYSHAVHLVRFFIISFYIKFSDPELSLPPSFLLKGNGCAFRYINRRYL